ncbi:MAG: hypothetical protein IT328_20065 [Caldilineaceae bacterium]|nr:hypothetical protein [Caldilineaceae bacterium]
MNAMQPAQRPARTIRALFSNAHDAIGLLTPGARVVGLTKGQFSLLDLVNAVLGQVGPAELMVSTWRIGRVELEHVANLLDAHNIWRFRLLVDSSLLIRQPEEVALIHRLFGAETIRQTHTHANFALIGGGEHRVTIRGSMTFSRNPRFEQFDLDDDPDIYSFFDRNVEELYGLVPPGVEAEGAAIHHGFHAFGHPPGYSVRSFICGDLFRRLGRPQQAAQLHPLDELDEMLRDMNAMPRVSREDNQLLDELLRQGMDEGYEQ